MSAETSNDPIPSTFSLGMLFLLVRASAHLYQPNTVGATDNEQGNHKAAECGTGNLPVSSFLQKHGRVARATMNVQRLLRNEEQKIGQVIRRAFSGYDGDLAVFLQRDALAWTAIRNTHSPCWAR